MAEALTYTCGCCGEVHKGLPDFGFDSPDFYWDVPETERDRRSTLDNNFCSIDGEYFFVRCVLEIPIIGTEDSFGWGVWSSLSETNYKRYQDVFLADQRSGEGPYFGWLSNRLPFYPETLQLSQKVHPQDDNMRPLLELEPTDHPLAVDQREGMPMERAIEFAQRLMHRDFDFSI
ncbi:MAG: DUF2199 domain-containing protein [Pseudomonadota bacterium]